MITPGEMQRKVLRAMSSGTELSAHPRQALGYYYKLGGDNVPESIVRDMCDAGLLASRGMTMMPGRGEHFTAVYVITDAGRAALEEEE